MAHELYCAVKEKKEVILAEVVNLHPAMRAFSASFIDSNRGQKYRVSELHQCKNTFHG